MRLSFCCDGAGVLVVGLLAANLVAAVEPDLLQDAKRRQEVAAQRLETEVRQGLVDAARLQRTQPGKASDLLRDLLREVDDDNTLPPERRAALRQRLRNTLRNLELDANRQTGRRIDEASRQAEVSTRRIEDERSRADAFRLSQQMQQINELRRLGRFDEANRRSTELAARHPDNPAVIASQRTSGLGDRVGDARTRRADRNDRLLSVDRDVDKSSTLPADDMELPRDWREKSQRRSPGSKMTEKEKAILKALDSPIQAELTGTFAQAIDYLQTVLGHSIVLDDQALKEANVSSETQVNVKLRKVSARTALKKLLADHDLAYVIRDQTIHVTTLARARESMTTRTYYIGDLAGLADVRFGPYLNQLQAVQSISLIIDMVQNQVDPSSWRANGGSGSISFDPSSMSLIVRQTAEVHMMMGGAR